MPRSSASQGPHRTSAHLAGAATSGPLLRHGRRTAAVLCACVLGTCLVVTLLLGSGLVGSPLTQRSSSGNTKATCLYTRHDISQLTSLQKTLGAPINCAILFNDATESWAQWEDPWFTHAPSSQPQYQWPAWVRASPKRLVVVTQSLVPKEVPADWRTRGAAGQYDAYIRALGDHLVEAGMAHAIIRLGHEANGNWYRDDIGTTAADHKAWSAYWARISRILKAVPGAHFELDWTIAAGVAPTPFDDYYPGDKAVDIIGADVYDSSGANDRIQPARWQHEEAAKGGIGALVNFAKAHDKPLSIPEWGLVTADKPDGDGDDPYFVEQIANLVEQNRVRYQGYFETQPAQGIFGTAPKSLAVWVARYGAHGNARGSDR